MKTPPFLFTLFFYISQKTVINVPLDSSSKYIKNQNAKKTARRILLIFPGLKLGDGALDYEPRSLKLKPT